MGQHQKNIHGSKMLRTHKPNKKFSKRDIRKKVNNHYRYIRNTKSITLYSGILYTRIYLCNDISITNIKKSFNISDNIVCCD